MYSYIKCAKASLFPLIYLFCFVLFKFPFFFSVYFCIFIFNWFGIFLASFKFVAFFCCLIQFTHTQNIISFSLSKSRFVIKTTTQKKRIYIYFILDYLTYRFNLMSILI